VETRAYTRPRSNHYKIKLNAMNKESYRRHVGIIHRGHLTERNNGPNVRGREGEKFWSQPSGPGPLRPTGAWMQFAEQKRQRFWPNGTNEH